MATRSHIICKAFCKTGPPCPISHIYYIKSLGRNVIGLTWVNTQLHCVNTAGRHVIGQAALCPGSLSRSHGNRWGSVKTSSPVQRAVFCWKDKSNRCLPHLTLFGMEMCPSWIPFPCVAHPASVKGSLPNLSELKYQYLGDSNWIVFPSLLWYFFCVFSADFKQGADSEMLLLWKVFCLFLLCLPVKYVGNWGAMLTIHKGEGERPKDKWPYETQFFKVKL